MSINDLRVERISLLPDRLDRLREEAAEEGSDIIEDLWSEWQDNTNRFTRPGEMLVAATVNSELAGIGGIMQDFVDPASLRMRRFYVRRGYRRRGVGRAIARYVLCHALPLKREIVLHAEGAEAKTFWEELGFVEIDRENTTHFFRA